MTYLHPQLLTPDPTVAGSPRDAGDNEQALDLFPYRLVRAAPSLPALSAWAGRLDLLHDPGPMELQPDGNGRAELMLDFGTELHAWLELIVGAPRLCHVMAVFGEHPAEAEGFVVCTEPRPEILRTVPAGAASSVRFDEFKAVCLGNRQPSLRGFRFVRLLFHDLPEKITLRQVCAHAMFTFRERRGEFRCSDQRLQRAWQTSLYTARVCTQPAAIWDGIKRDRVGWYGDARISQLAIDSVYHDSRPADGMLPALPTDNWVNSVPTYSFDAIAMLKQRILAFGSAAPCVAETYEKVRTFLAWVKQTQINQDGFIIRSDNLKFFADLGFLDWSLMPVGGRFEELCWLQAKYVEALRTAAVVAGWLGRPEDAAAWESQAQALHDLVVRRFWDPAQGFLHTLNHVGQVPNPYKLVGFPHYQRTYVEGIRLGPSGPSRQSNAYAVLAGLCTPAMAGSVLRQVFANPAIEPIITAYFRYYENCARAECGDSAGALLDMLGYIAGMIEAEDAATIWEVYDPRVTDLSRYYGGFDVTWDWEISFCHGWGAGLVPLVQQWLFGVEPTEPGFGAVRLAPARPAPWPIAFEAALPTPHGPIRIVQESSDAPLRYALPKAIGVTDPTPREVVVERAG